MASTSMTLDVNAASGSASPCLNGQARRLELGGQLVHAGARNTAVGIA
jgi:hypothetical protein